MIQIQRIKGITLGLILLLTCAVQAQTNRDSLKVIHGKPVLIEGEATDEFKVPKIPSSSLKIQEPIIELPQNIQVITQAKLADQQIYDMLEGATRNVSGVVRMEHWDNYAYVWMRGSQISAFRNGMNTTFGWGPLAEDMSMVERIEFVKGPAGFMLANGEPGGFYNVVTKKPTGGEHAAVSIGAGSYNTIRGTVDLDGRLRSDGSLIYRLNVMGLHSAIQVHNDFNDRFSFAPVLTYLLDESTTATLEYNYQTQKQAPLGSHYQFSLKGYEDVPANFTSADPGMEPNTINDHSIFLTLNHAIDANWNLTGQIAFFDYQQVGSSMWYSTIFDNGDMERYVGIWDASSKNTFGQVFLNGNLTTSEVAHRVLVGLDGANKKYAADWSQSYSPDSAGRYFNIYNPVYGNINQYIKPFDRSIELNSRPGVNRDEVNYMSLYVQDELGFFDNTFRLTLAGRYAHTTTNSYGATTDDDIITPRLGVSYSIDENTSVYGLYDQGYSPTTGSDFDGEPFKPVTGNNIEAGLKRNWWNGRWNSSLSLYQITKDNVLTNDPEHINFSIQLGQTRSQGVELDINGEIFTGLGLTFNYAYTSSTISKDTRDSMVGRRTPGLIEHVNNMWLTYRFTDHTLQGFGVSLGYQFQAGRYSWYSFEGNEQLQPDYFRLDASISYKTDAFNVTLLVNNLLDTYLYSGSLYEYGAPPVYFWVSEPPRNFRVNFEYKI